MRARTAATPAAAAAAAAAARGEGLQLIPVAFTADEDGLGEGDFECDEGFESAEGAEGADDLDDVPELAANDKEDTGELYDLEEFQRLLKADILAHHTAKVESRAAVAEADGENTPEGDGADEGVEPTGNTKGDGPAEADTSDGAAPARTTGADTDKADAVDSADGQA